MRKASASAKSTKSTRREGQHELTPRRPRSLRSVDLARFRGALDVRYGELARTIERVERAATIQPGAEPALLPGDEDVVVELQDHDFDILERQDRALADVWRALERIEAGTYGRCEGCAGWIAHERLEILPETTLCQLCQRGIRIRRGAS
jgi:RNA polymerase-binding transcription factor DksA